VGGGGEGVSQGVAVDVRKADQVVAWGGL